MTVFRLASRSLINNKRFSLLFAINLSVGLLGFIGLDSFKRSFQQMLDASSQKLLSADLVVSARRDISSEERNIIQATLPEKSLSYEMYTLYSMVSAPTSDRSQLVEVKAIEDTFPFYGSITLQEKGVVDGSSPKILNEQAAVWLSRDLSLSLAVRIGDSISIGDKAFRVADIITDETSSSWSGASLAPRLYIGMKQLKETGLVREGSTIWRAILIKIPSTASSLELENQLFNQLRSPSIRVRSHKKASEQNGQVLAYLSDYLGLVSLVAFFLSGLGALYLFRAYLLQKHKEIATLISLGLSHQRAIFIYALQIMILGFTAAAISSIFVWLLLPSARTLIETLTPVEFTPVFSIVTVFVAIAMGALGTLTLCLPLFPYIKQLSPATLFQESYQPVLRSNASTLLLSLPAIAGFYAISVWQANSWLVGSLFFFLLGISCLVLIGLGSVLLSILAKLKFTKVSSRLAQSYLTSQRLHATSSFLALSIGALLINLIPQLENSILKELKQPEGSLVPSLFLFDIQEDQKESLEKLVEGQNTRLQTLSPFIRGRLISINGKPFTKGDNEENFSREAQREQRFRNRGVNLSYRGEFSASETISEGRPFSGPYDWNSDKPTEISVEFRYANRLGLNLGDSLVFDVQGMEIKSEIVSVRKVKWNSFQPNFFIQFQEGVLEDAPKTFLASIPPLTEERKLDLQNLIAEKFPNISAIDVTQLVDKISATIIQMSLILKVMAWITIIAGMIVIFSIATHQTRQRLWDMNLLKILGASFGDIHAMISKEFALLSMAASIFGALAGLLASFVISHFVFEGIWSPSVLVPVATTIAMTVLCISVAQIAVRKTLAKKAAWALQKDN